MELQFVGEVNENERHHVKFLCGLRNLSLLQQIRLPNMVEAFVQLLKPTSHTFLFPIAGHGDLEKAA